MRLNRFLASSGLGSRRSCEELILGGNVTVNGQVCQNLATDVTDADFVKVGSRHIVPEKPLYILLHKPRGYLCTVADTHDRRTVFDLLPGHWPRLFHVGRLDLDSEGLLILTNDGDLALRLTHPRYKTEKEYEVLLDKPYNAAADTPRLLHGVSIEGGRAKAESVRQLAPNLLRIVLRQGLKRQIRLMLYRLGYEVERLVRMRIGSLRLTELRVGEWRALTAAEVKMLQTERAQPPAKKTITDKEEGKAEPGRAKKPASQDRPRKTGAPTGRASAKPQRHRDGKTTWTRGARGGASPARKAAGKVTRQKDSGASTPRAGRRP